MSAIQREDADTGSVATKIVSLARTKQSWSRTLLSLGMSEAQIDEMMATRKVPDVVYLRSPIDGFILGRHIAAGQRFERRAEFYRIADLHRVWIICELFNGEERWLQTDPVTRALQVRLEAENSELRLRPGMLVSVDLQVPAPPGVSVPADAVVDSGLSQRVYVNVGPGSFQAREVRIGEHFGDRVQILSGLTAGERFVASGRGAARRRTAEPI